ncbi:MAG: AAA family ATPase, partial [Thermoleophilaceae bacterium]|nr:AAA family ATPase [Thermoleophilaceae bacterium]
MTCATCGTANEAGRKFCAECGAPLVVVCPACGGPNRPAAKFCGECGTALSGGATARAGGGPATAAIAPVAERRLVSVLFADLVGFTTLSESRDPESVRELLGRYFEVASDIIGRYGGTIEKFIGDAVMAVWGAPTAHEDDAERAVRSALDLVEAVRRLGQEVDAELMLRAGVLTGEAAVTLGATNQGMVAGDLVNTASRLQSIAPPGTVLVGESTFHAASGAVAFEPAGEQLLKGRQTPAPAFRALRVMARRGGAGRSEQLEPPFVGRAPELRMLKDFHAATAAERRPRLVSIMGQGGIGKTRLVWEFQKYMDGVTEVVYWHQGRSPAYGEGISFWALAEMVRGRAGIQDSDEPGTARSKLAATLDTWIGDDAERRWLEPRLLQLLGLESAEGERPDRESLFAAWRIFFERIAERGVVVLVFEDLQWADGGLLDFIDHVMEWSRDRPLYLITMARPELLDRRPDWGAGRRSFTSLLLEPLAEADMRELLTGLVPGLPEPAVARVLGRAEGIPLYAVETVRMLLAEGRLERDKDTYRPVGDLSELSMPPSLHALIAARLDALEPAERSLLQAASVIGKTFDAAALTAVSSVDTDEVAVRLASLARRELLSREIDPRSPEQGQYGFVQGLIREVAYGTLARRDRRTLHVAAARYFETLDDEGITGVLAEHYLAAYRAQPDGPEGEAVAAQARIALRAAAERARSLGSFVQAVRYLEQALDVTTDPDEEFALRTLAGDAATYAGLSDEPTVHLQRALELARQGTDRRRTLDAIVYYAFARSRLGLVTEGVELMEPARIEYADLSGTPEFVRLDAELARSYLLLGDDEKANEVVDQALPTAEKLELSWETIGLLVTRGAALATLGRLREAIVTLVGAVSVSSSHQLPALELRARVNLSFAAAADDPKLAYATARDGYDLANHLGYRGYQYLLGNAVELAIRIGEWDWAATTLAEALVPGEETRNQTADWRDAQLRGLRGERGVKVDDVLDRIASALGDVTEAQVLMSIHEGRGELALARGEIEDGYRLSMAAFRAHIAPDSGALPRAARAAAWLGDLVALRETRQLIDPFPGRLPAAWRREVDAAIAALEGRREEATSLFLEALDRLRDLGVMYERAVVAVTAVKLLGPDIPELHAAVEEADATFRRLGAS